MPLSGCSARNVYSRCFRETIPGWRRPPPLHRDSRVCIPDVYIVHIGAECSRHVIALSGPEMPLAA